MEELYTLKNKQVEKAWMGCKYCDEEWGTCNPITNRFTMPPRGGIRFCPMCGRPLTDEAVDMVMERIEVFKKEFAWELTFDKEIQDELRKMRNAFYDLAKQFYMERT